MSTDFFYALYQLNDTRVNGSADFILHAIDDVLFAPPMQRVTRVYRLEVFDAFEDQFALLTIDEGSFLCTNAFEQCYRLFFLDRLS